MNKQDYPYIFVDSNMLILEALLSCRFKKEDDWILAECLELQLIDQGKTRAEATINLIEMITLVLLDGFFSGNLEAILHKHEFRKARMNILNHQLYKHKKPISDRHQLLIINSQIPPIVSVHANH
jgi:hypothetical protein